MEFIHSSINQFRFCWIMVQWIIGCEAQVSFGSRCLSNKTDSSGTLNCEFRVLIDGCCGFLLYQATRLFSSSQNQVARFYLLSLKIWVYFPMSIGRSCFVSFRRHFEHYSIHVSSRHCAPNTSGLRFCILCVSLLMFVNEKWLEDIFLSFKFYLLQGSHKDIFWQDKGLVGLNWKVWGHGIRNGTIDSCWSRPFLFSSLLVFAHNTSQGGLVVLRISWLYFFHISIFVISSSKHYICVRMSFSFVQ